VSLSLRTITEAHFVEEGGNLFHVPLEYNIVRNVWEEEAPLSNVTCVERHDGSFSLPLIFF
jgi:hypothetical protein